MSKLAALARLFRSRSGEWIDGRELARVAGAYAWRTRVSDLRQPPYSMLLLNRQRRVRVRGGVAIVSEYKFGRRARHAFRRVLGRKAAA